MSNSFDSYIKQLRELEQSENRAALYSFCSLNEPTLSYFKSIWEPIQAIMFSSHIDTHIIDDIKPVLTHLSEIKEKYESLKRNPSKEYSNDIINFQSQIDSVTVTTYSYVWERLLALDKINTEAIENAKKESSKNNNKSFVKTNDDEKTIFLKYDGVDYSTDKERRQIDIYFDGKHIGTPTTRVSLPREQVNKKHILEVIYRPKSKKLKWVLNGLADAYYFEPRMAIWSSLIHNDPIVLYIKHSGQRVELVPDSISSF